MKNNLALIRKILNGIYLKTQIDDLHADISYLTELIDSNEYQAIMNPISGIVQKQTIYLNKALTELKSEKLQKHLLSQLKKGELEDFKSAELRLFLKSLQLELTQYQIVKIQVAVEFKPSDLRDMTQILERQSPQPVAFDLTIDPSLIGGAIIQYGNHVIDQSLKTRMNQFKENWQASVKE